MIMVKAVTVKAVRKNDIHKCIMIYARGDIHVQISCYVCEYHSFLCNRSTYISNPVPK